MLRELIAEHGPLYLLLDDSGCCGPGNVFVQAETPRESYLPIGEAAGIPVSIDPGFLRGDDPARLSLDLRPAPNDDSFSLEARHSQRFTVTFEPELEGRSLRLGVREPDVDRERPGVRPRAPRELARERLPVPR